MSVDAIDFGGFFIPAHALSPNGALPEEVVVSIRPQSIHLLREKPAAAAQRCCVEGSVQRRAYLGESWDYHVRFAAALEPLRVTARPNDCGRR